MATRSYVVSIPGGTATTSVQIQGSGTLKQVYMSIVPAAAGTWELSLSSTSQISSAAPDTSVLARVRISATTPSSGLARFELQVPVKAFQTLYLHCTGAGNVGELVLIV
jgi:hypothetical protein